MREKLKAREISYIALGTALICACAWLSIPFTVPITMQSFAVCLLAALLGLRGGLWAVSLYILLGAAGLPVFSLFRGGLGVLFGAGGGYIFGFILLALSVGYASERFGRGMRVLIASMSVGTLLCYALGSLWYALVYAQGSDSIKSILGLYVLPFVFPDAVKIFLAALLSKRIYPIIHAKSDIRRETPMTLKNTCTLQILAQKDPGPYVSYTYSVIWLENGKEKPRPQESSREFQLASGFEAAGRKYVRLSQLLTEKINDSGEYKDIYGRRVFEVKERFPCFDSYDYLHENRYYRWFYIQEDGMLCCIYYADQRDTVKVTENTGKVNERSFKAMKEAGYCDCIEE